MQQCKSFVYISFVVVFLLVIEVVNAQDIKQVADSKNDKPLVQHAFERRLSDNFPYRSLTQLLRINAAQLKSNPSHKWWEQCNTIHKAILDGEVDYIESEWEVFNYDAPQLDEFKVCNNKYVTRDDNEYFMEKFYPLGYKRFDLKYEQKYPERVTSYRKYQTELNGKQLIWLETIPTRENKRSTTEIYGAGALRNVVLEQCLADTTRNEAMVLDEIWVKRNSKVPWISLVKNGLFQYNNHIYKYTYKTSPLFNRINVKFYQQSNYEPRESFRLPPDGDSGWKKEDRKISLNCSINNREHIKVIETQFKGEKP